jgi:alpha-glucosidase
MSSDITQPAPAIQAIQAIHPIHLAQHEFGPYFLQPLTGQIGDRLLVSLRLPASVKATAVFVTVLHSGEAGRSAMKLIGSQHIAGLEWQCYQGSLKITTPTTRYMFVVVTADDTWYVSNRGSHHYNAPYREWFQYLAGYSLPSWIEKTIFYYIFPDRFRNGNPSISVKSKEYKYKGKDTIQRDWSGVPTVGKNEIEHFGGDLAGVTEKLDYVVELGATALYLTPIFESPSNHRYDISDYYAVDKHLGGQAAFEQLRDACKSQGLRLMIDGVFNHTGNDGQLFRQALAGGPERELFSWHDDGRYVAFYDVPTMPKINYASEKAYQYFIDGPNSVVRHWLRQGVDAWRLDVAHMMGADGLDTDNLLVHRRLKAAASQENPDSYVLGERSWDSEAALHLSELGESGEDGVMNYFGFTHPIMDWLSGVRIWDTPSQMTSTELAEVVTEAWRVLPPQKRLGQFNFIGSHDIPRPLERLHGDTERLKTGFALMFAFPGVPAIYYGDEIGVRGGGDPQNRAIFPWDERTWNHDLRASVKQLAQIRLQESALQSGDLRWLLAEGDVVAFARTLTQVNGQRQVVILLASRQNTPVRLVLPLFKLGIQQGVLQNLLTKAEIAVTNGQATLELQGFQLLRLG